MLQAIRQFLADLFLPAQSAPAAAEYVVVDTDRRPRLPSGFSLDEHRGMGLVRLEKKNGKLYANGDEVQSYLSPNQQDDGSWMSGHKLRKELGATPGRNLNACVKDALLDHPELIPDGVRVLYFFDTTSKDKYGNLRVSCLIRDNACWGEYWRDLGLGWDFFQPSARVGEQ